MQSRFGAAACVLGLTVPVACDGKASPHPPVVRGVIESHASDSAGIRVVESSESALDTRLPWLTDTMPDLELGGMDGEGPFVFSGIQGVVGLVNGSIVVVDRGSGEIRWFSASGSHQQTAGGQGLGPSEFMRPELVSRFQQDSLMVHDRSRRRLVLVASDGSGMEALRRPKADAGLFVGSPEAVVDHGVVYRAAGANPDGCPDNEHCEMSMELRWVDFDTGESRVLAEYVKRWLNYVDARGRRFLLDGFLDAKGLVAAAPTGPVVEGPSHFELRQLAADGEPRMIMRLSGATEPATRASLDRFVSEAPDRREMERVIDMMELPDALPAFIALKVDRMGWYWARLFSPDDTGPSEWLVFDTEGRALGVVAFPSRFEVTWVGRDHVLGTWTDSLDVEYVRRYLLDRWAHDRL